MEIMVYCYADNNASIGAGIDTAESTELKEYSWLYEGFSESYYELYRDFEDIIKKTAEFGCELLKAENLNEQAVEQAARSGLIDACGEIEVMYEVDGQQTDECCIDRNEVIEAFYTALESDVVLQIRANTKLQ